MSTKPSDDETEPAPKRWRLGLVSRLLLLIGILVLVAFLCWPLYAPVAIRWAVNTYAPAGWSITISEITARYQAVRLDQVTVSTDLGVTASGLQIDVAHPRALLTRGMGDVALRVRGGEVVAGTASTETTDISSPTLNQQLAQITAQVEAALALTIPSPSIIPLADLRVEALTVSAPGIGSALIHGQGGLGRDYRITADAMQPYGVAGEMVWAQDASVRADFQTTRPNQQATTHAGTMAFRLAIPKGRLVAGEGSLTINQLKLDADLLPNALKRLLAQGFSANVTMSPNDGIAGTASFGPKGVLSLAVPWPRFNHAGTPPLPDAQEASPDQQIPVTVEAKELAIAGWVLSLPEQQWTVICCEDDRLAVRADAFDIALEGAAQPLGFGLKGGMNASYHHRQADLTATANFEVVGQSGLLEGARLSGVAELDGPSDGIAFTVDGRLFDWPDQLGTGIGPLVDYALAGQFEGRTVDGRLAINLPELTGFPELPFDYQADITAAQLDLKLPTTRFQLAREWLNPSKKLSPGWVYQSLTALNGHVILGGTMRFRDAVSARLDVAADIEAGELFGTTISNLTITDQIRVENNQIAPGPDSGQLRVGRWALGDSLALTDLKAAWRWRGASTLEIAPITAALLGGDMLIAGLTTAVPIKDLNTRLTVKNLSLEQFAETLDVPGLRAEGAINGGVDLVGDDGLWQLVDGQFIAENGRLQYSGAVGNAAVAEQANLAFDVLENFEYDNLTMSLEGVIGGNQSAQLRLVGRNPAVYDGYPVDLNINLTGALDAIAQSSLDALAIPDRIARQLAPQ